MSTTPAKRYILLMIAFLETAEAKAEAERMAEAILSSGSIAFPPSDGYPASLLSPDTTLAVLIATPPSSKERKVLRAISGTGDAILSVPGYVPPCFSVSLWREIMAGNDARIHELSAMVDSGHEELRSERAALTAESLSRLRALYSFRCADGCDIPLPDGAPGGTGDCAGLRAINTALRKGWEIKGLAEFRIRDGSLGFHPPCSSRCGLLLPRMLGLDFIYADSSIAVIDKEAGLLSVPGRGAGKLDSAAYRFHRLFPSSPVECYTHRLDMDTSGLLVMAFTKEAHRAMCMAFEAHEVRKEYEALLCGVLKEDDGVVDLPIRLDPDNRPYQIVDMERGKRAITHWKRIRVEIIDGEAYTRVRFQPQTGRTHQLRVHSAAIGHPIKGDRLYGTRKEGERLALHASSITFRHPVSGDEVTFSSPAPF